MSDALANASRLKPDVRLAEAVSKFVADLSNEQKTTFHAYRSKPRHCPPDPKDVMRLTAEIDRQAFGKASGRRCVGPRLTNFLQAVQQYAALGDVIMGATQNLIAAGVWSLVRLSLLSIVNSFSYLERISILLMSVGRSAPRYQMMALLCPHSKSLQPQLCEYFIVVVRLCHQLLIFTQKSPFGQFVSSLSDSEVKTYQSDLDLWANMIKEEVHLQMAKKIEEEAQENSRSRTLSKKFFESKSSRQKTKIKLRVLDLCSVYDYETAWKQTRKIGSTTLLDGNAEYKAWKSETDSCTLICLGKLGCGKSVLLANVVDELYLSIQHEKVTIAYFFCRHDIPESLNSRTIIGSLARQILCPIVDLERVADLFDQATRSLDSDRVLALVRCALPPDCKIYFILDGLDECESREQRILFEELEKLQSDFSLSLCISRRLEPNSVSMLFSDRTKIFSIPDDNPDINTFIQTELERRIESGKLLIGEPLLILEMRSALLEGSKGMFLWVALQIESLCTMQTDDGIRNALADLPTDLPETFLRILQSSGRQKNPYQRRILELIAVARRPLTVEELREALGVVPGDAVWNPARLLNDVFGTIKCCDCLLTLDEEESTVRLVHHSVKQFILSGSKDSSNVPFAIENAEIKMAEIIVTYLSYGIFETQLSTKVAPHMKVGSAPSTIIRSTLGSSSSAVDFTLRLLKSRTSLNEDIGRTLAEANARHKYRSVDKFHFLPYAKSYWLQHISCASEHETIAVNLLPRLVQGQTIYVNEIDKTIQELLSGAVVTRREAVVKLLVATGKVNLDPMDSLNGQTPLSKAAERGDEVIVKLLLDTGKVDVDSTDRASQTPLSKAAERNRKAIVKLLLAKDKADINSRDWDSQTALSLAAGKGHEAIVKLLLATGKVDVNSKDRKRRTALSLTVEKGHEAIVKLLLATDNIDVNSKNKNGQTALMLAIEKDHKAIIKLLLETGKANINLKDGNG